MKFHLPLFVSLTAIFGLTCCGIEKTTTPIEATRFLKSTGVDLSQRSKRLPFQQSWSDPKIDISRYKHIVVRPVSTSFLKTELWEKSKGPNTTSKRAYTKRCVALARHWDKSLAKAFSSPICVFYKTNDTQQPGTLILEIALTEVQFDPNPETPSAVRAIIGLPLCAFEARITDAATGRLIATCADRRGPDLNVSKTGQPSPLKSSEMICNEWAEQLMQASNKELFPTVRRGWLNVF
jgi:hypothetical protein